MMWVGEPAMPSTWPRVALDAKTLAVKWVHAMAPPEDTAEHLVCSHYPVFAEGQLYYVVASGSKSVFQGPWGYETEVEYAFSKWGTNLFLYSANPATGQIQFSRSITYSPTADYPNFENAAHFGRGQDLVHAGRALWWLDRPTTLRQLYYAYTSAPDLDFAPHCSKLRMIPLVPPT